MPVVPEDGAQLVGFAWRVLRHKKLRTAVAVSGIAFAILFMFMQLGFSGAVTATAVAVSSRLDADLVLVSSRFLHLAQSGSIPRSRLYQARALPEVSGVTPLYMRFARWKAPVTGRRCSMFAIGFPLSEPVPLRLPELAASAAALRVPGSVAADRISQDKCGVSEKLREVEIRERASAVVGRFSMGVGFLGDGAIVTSDETYAQLFAGQSLDQVDVALVRLRPGSDAKALGARLKTMLPPDTQVLTLEQLGALQTRYWVEDTAIGNIFAMGTLVGFFVGTMILYQVLSTDIRTQLPQYATLKAMGYPDRKLYLLVMLQSWLYALLGYLPGVALSALLYWVAYDATRIPIALSLSRALLVLLLSFMMCTASGLLSLRRIGRADPAELF